MRPKLNQRSKSKELIDSIDVPANETIRNLKELDIYNRLTGSIWLTIQQLKKLNLKSGIQYNLVDLGCGGGEFILQVAKWASRNDLDIMLSGIDNNPVAIEYLLSRSRQYNQVKVYNTDYKTFLKETDQQIDIIHCALFTHHLDDDEIITLFKAVKQFNSVLIINDLKRSLAAYYGAIAITRLMNGTKLAKHDGPLSVLRGFKKNEIINLAEKAGVNIKCICTVPFFRYLFVITP